MTCKNCGAEVNQNYCPNCGHPKKLNRIDVQYILSEIGSVLNFDKGILFTIRELLLRPGESVRKFISEDRNRLVKPIAFIIISSLTYTIFQQFLHFEDQYIKASVGQESSAISIIFNWIANNYGYSNILMALFIAFWIKIFFKKYNYNIFEILILLLFLIGVGMLAFTFFGIISSVSNINILANGGAVIVFIYISWGIGQFFDKKKIINYLKGSLSYLLGMISFTLLALVLGVLINLIEKH